ncbi:MAG: CotH kinase family protein [Oscillospiraceae bacterium]|nr:CotH kinase family protein [Oscillospiraceae bacterium]
MTKKAIRSIAIILLFCIVLTSAPFAMGAEVQESDPVGVIINQAHGAGGRTGAISHSFIELYNTTDAAVDLSTYSVQLTNDGTGMWHVLPLSGQTIAAQSSFLIVNPTGPPNAGEAAPRYVIQDWDLVWPQQISNSSFSIALVRNQTPLPSEPLPRTLDDPQMVALGVFDLVGTINEVIDPNHNFLGAEPVWRISRQRAIRRLYFSNTGDNSYDFTSYDYRVGNISDEQVARIRPRYSGDGPWYQAPQGPPQYPQQPLGVVINQMQGSGARTGALSHSFIELYNSSDEAVDLNDWSVQLLNQPRGEAPDGWHVLPLTGHTIEPHTSFLIVNPTGPPNPGEDPPRVVFAQWDIQWDNREISNHNFSVALVNNQTALPSAPLPHDINDPLIDTLGIVDLVGAFNEPQDRDANNHFFGQAPAGRNTRQQAVRRNYFQNTADNSVDFRSIDYAYPRGISDADVARFRPRSSHDGPWGQTRREITFSHEAGIYADPFYLTLTTAYEGAVIRFTTDGSEPTAASPVFPVAGLHIRENTAVPSAPPFQTYETNHVPISPVPFDHFNPRPNLSHVLRVRDQYNVIRSVGNNLDMGTVQRPNTPVFMGTALRVRLFAEDGTVLSPTQTRSFFVNADYAELPIVAITTDPGTLFTPDGLNFWSVGGIGLGINRRVLSRNAGGRGHAWEREGHMELIEPDGTVGISQQIGLRINGNQTRELAKRAWRIYARGEQNTFNYDIFQGRAQNYRHEPIHEFGRIIMRASGQDGRWSMMRDSMAHHMAIGTHAPRQAYRASVFFINGEFWGIYNIRERTDDQTYMRQNEFGSTDNVGEIGFSHSANNVPDAMRFERPEDREDKDYVDLAMYMQMWNWFNRNTPLVQAERRTYTWFQEAQRFLCIDNFIDNYIFTMFVSNTDWPGNNIELFRYSPPAYFAADLSYGFPFPTLADIQQGNLPDNNRDGRWRWYLKDLDYGMAAPRRFHMSRNMFEWLTVPSSDAVQAPWSTMMWRRFMDNPYFRAQYTNRMTDLMNTNLRTEVFHAEINRMAGDIAPVIPQEAGRWRVFTANQWANTVQTMRNFADIRQENMMNHARVAMNEGGSDVSLGLGAAVTLTLRSEGEMGFFRLNGMAIEEGTTPGVADQEEWTGLYFANTTQTIEAVEYPGFIFSHFIVNGVAQPAGEDTLQLRLTGDTTVEAIFQDSGAFVPVREIVGVPTSKAAAFDLSLDGVDVMPLRATHRNVVWSVADAGVTGATLTDCGVLSTTAPGTVVLTATIVNGLTEETDFVQTVTIQVLSFVPVQNIVGVPDRIIVTVPETLGGIVMPANATMQTIHWEVADAGTTGAAIVGNTLTATAPGLTALRATVTQGLSATANYERMFFVRAGVAGDPSALEALVALATPMQDRRLFIAGFDEFFVAKVDAEATIGGHSTQEEIDLAYQNLRAAWSRLQPQPGSLTASRSSLASLEIAGERVNLASSALRVAVEAETITLADVIYVPTYYGTTADVTITEDNGDYIVTIVATSSYGTRTYTIHVDLMRLPRTALAHFDFEGDAENRIPGSEFGAMTLVAPDGTHRAFVTDHETPPSIGNDGYLRLQNTTTRSSHTAGRARFPDGLFDGREQVTIAMDVYTTLADGFFFTFALQPENTFAFDGNTGRYFLNRVRGTGMRNAITVSGWGDNESGLDTPGWGTNTWSRVALVFDDTTMRVYLNGELVDYHNDMNTSIADLGNGGPLWAYLGRAPMAADRGFDGGFDNIKVWDYALSSGEVWAEFHANNSPPPSVVRAPHQEARQNVALAAGIADVSFLRPGRYDDVHTINDGIHVGNYIGARSGQRWTTFGNNSISESVTYIWPSGAMIDGTSISFTVDGDPPGIGGIRFPASYVFHYLPLSGNPNDPAAWRPLGSVTSGITADTVVGNYTAFAAPVEAWQLRVTIQKEAHNSNGIGIWEWEVYGNLLAHTPIVPDTYTLTVYGGSGSGDFMPGTVVNIMAEVPAGKLFVAWDATGDVQLASRYCAGTSIIMPPGGATITALFEPEDNREHQDAPTGLVGHPTRFADVNDGRITGVAETMEWAPGPDGPWERVVGDVVEGLAPGTYYVRHAETETHFASPTTQVTVEAGTGLAPAAEIDVAVDEYASVTIGITPPVAGSDIAAEGGKLVITLPDTDGDDVAVNLPVRPAEVDPEDWWRYTTGEDDGTATITITPPYGYEVVAYPEDSGDFILRPIAPTLTLNPIAVAINDEDTTVAVVVGGTADGTIYLDYSDLPTGVTVAVVDGEIVIIGVRPTTENASIIGIFDLVVMRQGVSETVVVDVNLTTTWVPLVVTLTPETVTITDSALTASVAVTGTAIGTIYLDTSDLPTGVTAAVVDGEIVITGVRPTAENTSIIGIFDLVVTRQGVSETVVVDVNLTTTWTPPVVTLTPETVTITDYALTASVTVTGTAIGDIALNTNNLPTGITAVVVDGDIVITGVRPTAENASIVETFDLVVTRQGVSETVVVDANLTTTWTPPTFTVTFALAGGTRTGGGALVQEVRAGERATAPEVTRTNYIFVRWDSAFTNITSDLTVTAVWEPIADTGEVPNRDALRAALAEVAEQLDEGSYSARSWATVVTARDAAQTVYINPASTQAQIDEATAALLEAIAGLEEFHRAYMFGNDRGEFRPGGDITRAEVAAILARVMIDDFDSDVRREDYELPESMSSFNEFPDVAANNWFYHYVAWVFYEGLVLGDTQGNFRPNSPITRQELAMMIARIDGIAEEAGAMSFGDAADIAGWARAAVYTVYRDDLMQGDNRGNFRPSANITRAEVATVMNRILGRLDSREAYRATDVERDNARAFPDVPVDRDPIQWYFPSVLAAANDHYLTRDDYGTIDWKFVRVQPQRGS